MHASLVPLQALQPTLLRWAPSSAGSVPPSPQFAPFPTPTRFLLTPNISQGHFSSAHLLEHALPPVPVPAGLLSQLSTSAPCFPADEMCVYPRITRRQQAHPGKRHCCMGKDSANRWLEEIEDVCYLVRALGLRVTQPQHITMFLSIFFFFFPT